MSRSLLVPAAILGVGLVLSGALVGAGFAEGRRAEHHVTVKGLAEREVPADLAIWPVTFTVGAEDLPALHRELKEDAEVVRTFLSSRFPGAEVRVGEPAVTDRAQQGWTGSAERYQAQLTVTLRTDDVPALHDAIAAADTLVEQGVAVVRSWDQPTRWLFTGLEDLKPDMIAEATRDARRAAEQFALDADASVGPIRTATQGYFSIEDRDPFSPEIKRVRVVTTVSFVLDD